MEPMKLKTVTITGADDSTAVGVLVDLSKEFPFVEWGILLSKSKMGSPRFPSLEWISELACVIPVGTPVSAHLCGTWVRELMLTGRHTWLHDLPVPLILFGRVQLNFHAERHPITDTRVTAAALASLPVDWIFQLDGVNAGIFNGMKAAHPTATFDGLFDASGGAGILPGQWPGHTGGYCGYAGGLGPDNLAEQLPLIAQAAGDRPFWIDMETRVRSDDDKTFDIAKVRQCLEICKPFVEGA